MKRKPPRIRRHSASTPKPLPCIEDEPKAQQAGLFEEADT